MKTKAEEIIIQAAIDNLPWHKAQAGEGYECACKVCCAANSILMEREKSSLRQFPIMEDWSGKKEGVFSIPWIMIEDHDNQAKLNHCGQNLEALARRGGLDVTEALAVLDDRRWKEMNVEAARRELKSRADRFLGKRINEKYKTNSN